jgi:hypothetical protein
VHEFHVEQKTWQLGWTQPPFWQMSPAAQALPQVPQFEGLLLVSVHVPLQRICPGLQPQTPFWQDTPGEQTLPHPPQLFRSVLGFVQTPLQIWPPSQGFEQPVQVLVNSLQFFAVQDWLHPVRVLISDSQGSQNGIQNPLPLPPTTGAAGITCPGSTPNTAAPGAQAV